MVEDQKKQTEQALHRAVAQYLDAVLPYGSWWSTFPAGGGGRIRGKILHGLGLKAGVPDVLIVFNGRALWIELKAPRKYSPPIQRQCHETLRLAGSLIAVARSIEEVELALSHWNVPLRASIK